jgi:hypothetical protein
MRTIRALAFSLLLPLVLACSNGNRQNYDMKLVDCANALELSSDTLSSDQADSLVQFIIAWGKEKYANPSLRRKFARQTGVNVAFKENGYDSLDADKFNFGYRLLGVARFWNIVEYYCPNRDITDVTWNQVLKPFILKAADKSIGVEALFAKLISQLNDTHAYTDYSIVAGGKVIPIVARFAEKRMIVTDTCTLSGTTFNPGDEILALDGVRPYDKIPQIATYTSHSNQASLVRDASYMSLIGDKDSVTVTYIANGDVKQSERRMKACKTDSFMSYVYSSLFPSDKPAVEMITDSSARINFGSFKASQSDSVFSAIRNTKRLICDLRTYPADYNVISAFMKRYLIRDKAPFCKTVIPLVLKPGEMPAPRPNTCSPEGKEHYEGKIVILVNGQTQSMAEYFAMILQSVKGSVTVGSQTAGADGNVTDIRLPYGITTRMTGMGVLYPDGTNAQRAGVKVDHVIEPSAQGLIDGRDEVLEYANTM